MHDPKGTKQAFVKTWNELAEAVNREDPEIVLQMYPTTVERQMEIFDDGYRLGYRHGLRVGVWSGIAIMCALDALYWLAILVHRWPMVDVGP
jgi:hypothetical protein